MCNICSVDDDVDDDDDDDDDDDNFEIEAGQKTYHIMFTLESLELVLRRFLQQQNLELRKGCVRSKRFLREISWNR